MEKILEEEIWKEVPDFPMYEASTLGKVRSLRKSEPHILSPGTSQRHRKTVILYNKKGRFGFSLHRIIALTFLGPCPNGLQVCHNNGDYLDNKLSNLRYDTFAENIKDVFKHNNGQFHTRKPERTQEILNFYESGKSISQIAKLLGLNYGTIRYHIKRYRNADNP